MADNDTPRSEIAQLGKFNLISKLTDNIKIEQPTTVVALGDDAAAARFDNRLTVAASKLFLENVHFDLSYFPLKHLGYKCAGIAVSDLLAMNATPSQLTVNIAVSNRFSVEAVEELLTGLRACCHFYKLDIASLDITSSVSGLALGLTALGSVEPNRLTRRTGTHENELICVSGDFGAAYTGLLLLQREKQVFETTGNNQPDFEGYEYLLERQLKPEPRLDIIEALRKNDILPTCMTVVSDGLASSLLHICHLNHLGCTIYENKTPVDTLTFQTLRSLKIVATTVALNGGEDYELLFTVKQEDYEKVKTIENVSVIGYMTEPNAGCNLITNDNRQISLRAQGFQGDSE